MYNADEWKKAAVQLPAAGHFKTVPIARDTLKAEVITKIDDGPAAIWRIGVLDNIIKSRYDEGISAGRQHKSATQQQAGHHPGIETKLLVVDEVLVLSPHIIGFGLYLYHELRYWVKPAKYIQATHTPIGSVNGFAIYPGAVRNVLEINPATGSNLVGKAVTYLWRNIDKRISTKRKPEVSPGEPAVLHGLVLCLHSNTNKKQEKTKNQVKVFHRVNLLHGIGVFQGRYTSVFTSPNFFCAHFHSKRKR